MIQQLKRTCWLCNKPLMAISHAEVTGPSGVVWVHKICEKNTREYFHKETAKPRDRTGSSAEQFYEE